MFISRSILTVCLFLPAVFSRQRKLHEGKLGHPHTCSKSSKSSKSSKPVVHEMFNLEGDDYLDISIGGNPFYLAGEFPLALAGTLLIDGGTYDTGDEEVDLDPDFFYHTTHCTVLQVPPIVTEVLNALGLDLAGLYNIVENNDVTGIEFPITIGGTTIADPAVFLASIVVNILIPLFTTGIGFESKLSCFIDICQGVNDADDPNCVYLRFSGNNEALLRITDGIEIFLTPFKATVIGGTGDYAASIGEAIVSPDETFSGGTIELKTIRSCALADLWETEDY